MTPDMGSGSVDRVGQQSGPARARCLGSVSLVDEKPQVVTLPKCFDARMPLAGAFVPGDSSVRRQRPRVTREVLRVRRSRYETKITAAVIKTIAVDVVNRSAVPVYESEQGAMQMDRPPSLLAVIAASRVARCQEPLPLVDEVSISGVDQCVSSDAAISGTERDTHGIIGTHQVPPALGVVPPDVYGVAGVSCVNYSKLGVM